MPKITALPVDTTAHPGDLFPIVDVATSVTKKVTYSQFPYNSGGASRLLAEKLGDFVSVKDPPFLAVGGGTTDDKAAIALALAASTSVTLNRDTYSCASRLNIPSSISGPGTLKSTAITSGGDFGISGSSVTIRDVTFTGSDESGGQILFFNAANLDRVFLDHVHLSNTLGASAQTGFQASTASLTKLTLRDADIRTSGFAFLLNSGATNAASVELNGGYYYSKFADAINLNAPAVSQLDISIVGVNTQSDSSFAIAIAGAKNVSIVGGTSSGSLLQDIHIEDAQNNVSIVGRVIREAQGDGIHILNNGVGSGVVVSACQLRAAAGNVSDGINVVADGSGSVDGCAITGNHVSGFQRGIALGFGTAQSCDGNVVENSTDAYFAVGKDTEPAACQHSGVNYANNCTNLVVIHNHGTFGKVISKTPPTAILVKEVVTNSPAMMLGFAFPTVSLNHGGAGAQLFTLFPVGDRMNGRITLAARFPGSVHTANYMADILWNGAALTINNPYTDLHGDFTAITVAVNAGNFQVSITSAVVHNGFFVAINFDGQYWKL